MATAVIASGQGPGEDDNGSRLRGAFFVALALHLGVAGGLIFWRPVVEAPPGEQEIQLDLAPQSVDAPTVETAESELTAGDPPQAETSRPPEAETVQPPKESKADEAPPDATSEKPAETKTMEVEPTETEQARTVTAEEVKPPPPSEVKKPSEVPPEEVRPIESTAETAPEMASEATTAKEEPNPTDKPTPPKPPDPVKKKIEQQRPQAARAREQQQAAERRRVGQAGESGYAEQRLSRNASSRENNSGRGAKADPNALGRYAGQLAGALRGRLRYPAGARSRGVAVLRFVVHRSGRVVSASIVRSAGDPALDRAALATASPGAMLPAAPRGVPQQTISVSVPLQFN